MCLFIHSSVNCHCPEVLKRVLYDKLKLTKNMLNSYFIIFSFSYIAY